MTGYNMGRPDKKAEIEAQHGPIIPYLHKLYDELGSGGEVAERLGVSPGTLSTWLQELGLVQWTILRPKQDAPAPVDSGQLELPLEGVKQTT